MCLLSGHGLEFFDGLVCLIWAPRCDVHFRVMLQQSLVVGCLALTGTGATLNDRLAFAVSHPTPVFAPVTRVTFPDRSGMSLVAHLGRGGRLWAIVDWRAPIDGRWGWKLGVFRLTNRSTPEYLICVMSSGWSVAQRARHCVVVE